MSQQNFLAGSTRLSNAPMNRKAIIALVLVSWLAASAEAALIDGVKAYYDFNQSSGSSLPLVVGTGSPGALNNMNDADWVPSRPNFGKALDFDGSDDFVHIPHGYTNTINGDDTHTVAMWIYPRSLADPVLLDAEDGTHTHDYFIEVSQVNSGYIAIDGVYRTYSGPGMSLNNWHHVAFTKTGPGNSGEFYIDGVKLTSFVGAFGSMKAMASDFLVGKFKNAGFNFNGMMDELTLWDRNLSDAEIAQLFSLSAELGQQFPAPVAAIPEPSSLMLFGLGSLALVRSSRCIARRGHSR